MKYRICGVAGALWNAPPSNIPIFIVSVGHLLCDFLPWFFFSKDVFVISQSVDICYGLVFSFVVFFFSFYGFVILFKGWRWEGCHPRDLRGLCSKIAVR